MFIRLFFVEKQKLVVHPHKNVQRVFFIYIGSFDTPSSYKEIKAGINFDSSTGNIEDWVIEE